MYECGVAGNGVHLLRCAGGRWKGGDGEGGEPGADEDFKEVVSLILYVTWEVSRGQRLAPRVDTLLVGAVSRHSLDSLNTSNDLQKRSRVLIVWLTPRSGVLKV